MGLDQYLTASNYIWSEDKGIKKKIKSIFPKIDLEPEKIVFKFITWRKANAIHKWFVDKVQEGNDDCKEYNVSLEQLKELLDIIKEILKEEETVKGLVKNLANHTKRNIEKAEALLPSQTGFFFGKSEYDEYYFQDLEETKEKLEYLFNNQELFKGFDFDYSSSW